MAQRASKKPRTAVQLAADGFAALVEKLGIADAIRYVQLYHQGEGDYTRERHQWLDPLSLADVAKLMGPSPRKRGERRKLS
ncbi:MAG: hypothetical protein K2R98_07130 [Gemmataceae bacterium]|nr:hypothetical protein [Gemmataceae bacterium]